MTPKDSKEIGRRIGFESAKKRILTQLGDIEEDVFAKFVEELDNIPASIRKFDDESIFDAYAYGVQQGVKQIFSAIRLMGKE